MIREWSAVALKKKRTVVWINDKLMINDRVNNRSMLKMNSTERKWKKVWEQYL